MYACISSQSMQMTGKETKSVEWKNNAVIGLSKEMSKKLRYFTLDIENGLESFSFTNACSRLTDYRYVRNIL